MSRSRAVVRFSSATTSPMNRCLQSCPISMALHSPSDVAPRAWRGISMHRAMSENFSRICSMTKGMQHCHKTVGIFSVSPISQHSSLAQGGAARTKTCFPSNQLSSDRIWFQFVETLARNHIDEWLLMRVHQQEGTL